MAIKGNKVLDEVPENTLSETYRQKKTPTCYMIPLS